MAQTPKRPRDPNQLAKLIAVIATGDVPESQGAESLPKGQPGGLVGGKARAAALSPEDRSSIAKRAAQTRWSKG